MPGPNVLMDDLRITRIDSGMVYFEIESGDDILRCSMPVGQYRRFLASATRMVDGWISAQRPPERIRRRVSAH